MEAVGFVEDWCKAVRAETERRLLNREEVPGFGLELGRQGPRKWTDKEAVETGARAVPAARGRCVQHEAQEPDTVRRPADQAGRR